MKYFAYGSNLCTKRLRERVPSAIFHKVAIVHGFTLRFHKRSNDGSAKANAFYTGNPSDEIFGAIFDIDESEKYELDEAEGRGRGYSQITIHPRGDGKEEEMFAYVADESVIDDSLKPYTWYKDLVVCGAREHSFPEDYIRKIESVPAKQDTNIARDEKHRKLLSNPEEDDF